MGKPCALGIRPSLLLGFAEVGPGRGVPTPMDEGVCGCRVPPDKPGVAADNEDCSPDPDEVDDRSGAGGIAVPGWMPCAFASFLSSLCQINTNE